jgi:hypothetical protein
MSSNVYRLIPVDPQLVPAEAAREAARAQLNAAIGRDVTVHVRDHAEFVDQGENFESVACPACEEMLDMEWWQERMGEASESHVLEVTVPCCAATTTLDDLVYEMPAGFARFVLEVEEADLEAWESLDLDALERTLGCELRSIVARY